MLVTGNDGGEHKVTLIFLMEASRDPSLIASDFCLFFSFVVLDCFVFFFYFVA